jgi:hypothetical protein
MYIAQWLELGKDKLLSFNFWNAIFPLVNRRIGRVG